MSRSLVSVLGVLLVIAFAACENVIHIPSSNGCSLFKVFIRQQDSVQTFSTSSNFNYVTGTNVAFHITNNTLFKITYQGTAEQHANVDIGFRLQILVNDLIISGNQLKSNTVVDSTAGYYWYQGASDSAVFVSRMAMVYLSPGIYSFNVGVQTLFPSLELNGGMVHYEIIQFDDQENALGDLPLTEIPSN
jgi:hypothetical protein